MTNAKPFLRWAGSKRQLLPHLRKFWCDRFSTYTEPFMGSCCLFFEVKPIFAILGDLNPALVDTYSTIRDHPRAVHNRLMQLPAGRAAYYQLRSVDPDRLPVVDRAARFVYLNRFCFNGLYRTNSSGAFNVPYSAAKTGQLPTCAELLRVSAALKKTELRCGDFEETIGSVRSSTFVYMDPPFAVGNRRMFRQYGPDSFGLKDLERLNDAARYIDRRGAHFLISYAMCAEAKRVFKQWRMRRVVVSRNISGFAKHRRNAVELLIYNAEP